MRCGEFADSYQALDLHGLPEYGVLLDLPGAVEKLLSLCLTCKTDTRFKIRELGCGHLSRMTCTK